MNRPPVALFAWRRPDHLRRVLESLEANPEAMETDVIAYCDAPAKPEHQDGCKQVRAMLRESWGFRSLRVVERELNLGLAGNIVSGVTETVQAHGRAIVLEDDLVVSPAFLGWMGRAMDLYADAPEVASVHGYWYPVPQTVPDSFFLRGADCWGWGVWERSWRVFRPDGAALLAEIERRGLEWSFDGDGSFPYVPMLRGQIEGRNDSWAIRWHASTFLAGMYTLFPGRSLVANIGADGTGSNHVERDERYTVELALEAPPLVEQRPREDPRVRTLLSDHHARSMGRSVLLRRLRNCFHLSRWEKGVSP
jgi:hypothetical protein